MNLEISMSESEELIREVVESGGEFQLYPKGTSMLPLLRQGRDSVVLVKVPEPIKRGDIPLYRRADGHYVLHRVIRAEKDGTYTMCGDNQTQLERGIRKEQMIATVSAFSRGDKRRAVDALSYRAYCFLWRSFFVRKVFFKLRRIFKRNKNKNA